MTERLRAVRQAAAVSMIRQSTEISSTYHGIKKGVLSGITPHSRVDRDRPAAIAITLLLITMEIVEHGPDMETSIAALETSKVAALSRVLMPPADEPEIMDTLQRHGWQDEGFTAAPDYKAVCNDLFGAIGRRLGLELRSMGVPEMETAITAALRTRAIPREEAGSRSPIRRVLPEPRRSERIRERDEREETQERFGERRWQRSTTTSSREGRGGRSSPAVAAAGERQRSRPPNKMEIMPTSGTVRLVSVERHQGAGGGDGGSSSVVVAPGPEAPGGSSGSSSAVAAPLDWEAPRSRCRSKTPSTRRKPPTRWVQKQEHVPIWVAPARISPVASASVKEEGEPEKEATEDRLFSDRMWRQLGKVMSREGRLQYKKEMISRRDRHEQLARRLYDERHARAGIQEFTKPPVVSAALMVHGRC